MALGFTVDVFFFPFFPFFCHTPTCLFVALQSAVTACMVWMSCELDGSSPTAFLRALSGGIGGRGGQQPAFVLEQLEAGVRCSTGNMRKFREICKNSVASVLLLIEGATLDAGKQRGTLWVVSVKLSFWILLPISWRDQRFKREVDHFVKQKHNLT